SAPARPLQRVRPGSTESGHLPPRHPPLDHPADRRCGGVRARASSADQAWVAGPVNGRGALLRGRIEPRGTAAALDRPSSTVQYFRLMPDPLEELHAVVRSAADSLRDGASDSIAPTLERPPKPELGDYSTNAAMLLAPGRGEPARDIAELLREELGSRLGPSVDRVEVAGPGFVNVFLADRWHRRSIASLLAAGDAFGPSRPDRPERVLIEFVSANPTGPLTVAAGRGAAYGDSLARLLELCGSHVEREYLLNDTG